MDTKCITYDERNKLLCIIQTSIKRQRIFASMRRLDLDSLRHVTTYTLLNGSTVLWQCTKTQAHYCAVLRPQLHTIRRARLRACVCVRVCVCVEANSSPQQTTLPDVAMHEKHLPQNTLQHLVTYWLQDVSKISTTFPWIPQNAAYSLQ
jgi:hypothetical protein